MSSFTRKLKKKLGIRYSLRDQNDIFYDRLNRSARISGLRRDGEGFTFSFGSRADLHARNWPHSDVQVLTQVLLEEEYKTITDYYKDNFPLETKLNIIDAGANVGYTSVYFLEQFPQASIACIEPDAGNLEMLKRNLVADIENGQVKIFANGLLAEGNKSISTDNAFRDGRDWSVSIKESAIESDLKSISIPQVMSIMRWERIDILKIDIEGSERFVFAKGAALEYLDRTMAIAIEIHDEFNCRKEIYDQFRNAGFVILNFGESTFALRKNKFVS